MRVNCEGLIITPGFVELQLNGLFTCILICVVGGFGVDFSTATTTNTEYIAGVYMVAHKLLSFGVTTFAPTIITSPPEVYHKVRFRVQTWKDDVSFFLFCNVVKVAPREPAF